MSCTYETRRAKPAPIWHRATCKECRAGAKADAVIAFALKCRRAESTPISVLPATLRALELPYSLPRPRRTALRRTGRKLLRVGAMLFAVTLVAGFGWTRYIDIE